MKKQRLPQKTRKAIDFVLKKARKFPAHMLVELPIEQRLACYTMLMPSRSTLSEILKLRKKFKTQITKCKGKNKKAFKYDGKWRKTCPDCSNHLNIWPESFGRTHLLCPVCGWSDRANFQDPTLYEGTSSNIQTEKKRAKCRKHS